MQIFPSFSSFPIFIISFSTTLILFSHIIDVPGIIPILAAIYLLLHVPSKVTNLGCVTLTILIGVSICEIRLLYDVLPRILTEYSNLWLLLVGHVFLVQYGVILFLEFGAQKLQAEDRDLFLGHCSPVLLISFPVTIATIWTMMISSLGVPLAWVPFVFQLTLFGIFQLVLIPPGLPEQQNRNSPTPEQDACADTATVTDIENDTSTDICVSVDIAICLIQLVAGVLTQLLVTIHGAVMATPRAPQWSWTMRQSIVDHVSLWSVGVLLAALLPNAKTLQSVSTKLSDIQPKRLIVASGACCYVLLLPLLHVHGIHFHTSGLVLVEMIVLGAGFSLVTAFPGRSVTVIGISAAALTGTLVVEMPWGIQLLPRTRLLLESTYFGIVVMSVAGLAAQRGLAVALTRGGGHAPLRHPSLRCQQQHRSTQSPQFELSFLALITVFHVTEWNLYFTGLATPILVFMSALFLFAVEISLFSRGRISVTVGALIESQIFLKMLVLAMHCSTIDAGRVAIPLTTVIGSLMLGFILSYSIRQLHHHESNSSRQTVAMALIMPVTALLSLLLIRDPIIITIVYGITGEQLLVYPTVQHCLVLALVLDLVCHFRRRHNLTFLSKIRLLAVLVTSCSLINMTLPAGVLILGVYWLWVHQSDDRWVPARVLRRSVVVSVGIVLILAGLVGTDKLSALDVVLALPSVGSVLVLEQLVRQPSIRVFRRHLKRIWLLGAFLALLELVWAPHGGVRLFVVFAHHSAVAVLLARRSRLDDEHAISSSAFQDRPEGHRLEHMATALGRLQALSVVQAVVGGLIASRFAFSSPAVLALPVLLGFILHFGTANVAGGNSRDTNTGGCGYCRCEWRALLLSRRIDAVALIVSTVGAFLVFGIVQESPLLVRSSLGEDSGAASQLSLQLDLAVHVKAAFELGLAVLLGGCHGTMLIWAALAVAPHDCVVIPGCDLPNIDYWLVGYTAMVPASLGFVFCSTGPVSVALAVLSAAVGVRQLIF